MDILRDITLTLPDHDSSFNQKFLLFLSRFGTVDNEHFTFSKSNRGYFPNIHLTFADIQSSQTTFKTDHQEITIDIVNSTGKEVKSTHLYEPISLDEFLKRTKNLEFLGIDHVGFDMPWFETGVHPDMVMLRNKLKDTSLYHLFPTGEPWDFIIPATVNEILTNQINYDETRRPKFEIVSIDTVSTSLFQFDILIKEKYEALAAMFPESILDPNLKNMWVYIKNPYTIDICFVMNEHDEGDWSIFFKNFRLK